MKKQKIIGNFDELISETQMLIDKIIKDKIVDWNHFASWNAACSNAVELSFSNQGPLSRFQSIKFHPPTSGSLGVESQLYCLMGLFTAKNQLLANKYTLERWLEDDDEQLKLQESKQATIFIAHGGQHSTSVTSRLKEFLNSLGVRPIIIEDEPNLGLTPNEKVKKYMSLCNMGVAIVTGEDKLVNGEIHGRQNISHEIGMLQSADNIGGRIIILKENGVNLPSNYSEFVYESFSKKSLDKCYFRIIKELRGLGFLR